MAASSPTAALAPTRPASPLKALSFWGAGACPKPPPAFPAKMSKLRASTTAPGAIVHHYQSPAMVNAGLPGGEFGCGKDRRRRRLRTGRGPRVAVSEPRPLRNQFPPPCEGASGSASPRVSRSHTMSLARRNALHPLPGYPCPETTRGRSVRHSYTMSSCSISHFMAGTS
jgi:hypothetical protein